jgi:hypothetical protein
LTRRPVSVDNAAVTARASGYSYEVERDVRGPGDVEVALVRRESRRGPLGIGRRLGEPVVLFRRQFEPMLQLSRLETYAAQLERVAAHARDGTLGCFITTVTRDGFVGVTLYERWFDGDRLHCDVLAERSFDSEDDGTLVASAEFVAALDDWAERRNDERERIYLDASIEDDARLERAADRSAAAAELAAILADHTAA